MTLLDTTWSVAAAIVALPLLDFWHAYLSLAGATMGGTAALDASVRGALGWNVIAALRGRYVETPRPKRAGGLGALFLPQATPKLRSAQTRVWTSLARLVVFGFVGWVAGLTVSSYVMFDVTIIRLIQLALAAVVAGWWMREARRPAEQRVLSPTLALLGACSAAVFAIFTALPPAVFAK
jgi:hypothetical protein